MKTRIISMLVLAGMIVGANSALASRARVNVMGQGDNGFIFNGSGSMYYDDMSNIFHNPSYVNDFKNWVIIEKGVASGTTSSTANSEGGFVTSMMGFNFGFYFNRNDAFTYSRFDTKAGFTAPASSHGVRPIDFVIGGDHGVKWGLGLTYASSNGQTNSNRDRQLGVNAGVQVADFAPFINYRLIGRSTVISSGSETKDHDFTVGTKYTYGDWAPYVAFRRASNATTTANANTNNLTALSYLVGVGRNAKLGENARLVYNINYGKLINKSNAGGADIKETVIPIDLAIEADVASWITLRGGLQYRLMDSITGGAPVASAGTQADATSGRIGATFHVNKVDLDWALGQGTTGQGNIDSASAGFDSGTFTNLSLAYRW